MPPLASSDASTDSFETLGFEIEAEESQNGRLVVSAIEKVSVSASSSSDEEIIEAAEIKSILDNDDYLVEICEETEEEEDVFYNAIDSAITTFTCGLVEEPCHACKPLKSSLKDPNRPSSDMNHNVSFSKLCIREYDMTLGDHPSAVTGPPVQLSWDHKPENEIGLEEYERARQPRRNRRQLRLSYKDRERVLFKERGFTPDEVNSAWMEALTIRKQRKETLSLTETQRQVEEVWESTQRKIGRLFTLETS
jgi:hypothetical protein